MNRTIRFANGMKGQKTKECGGDDKLTQGKMLFDERVKFLGSLVEMGIYRVQGILINDYGWVRSVMDAVKGVVLFGKTNKR